MNIIGTRIGDAMTLNFGTSGSRLRNAHVADTAATSGLINLLVRPLVWVSVQGRYSTKATNGNSLWVILRSILSFRVRRILSQIQYWGGQGDCKILTIGGANEADLFMLLS